MKTLSFALYISLGVLMATPVLAHESDDDQPRMGRHDRVERDHHDRPRQFDLNHDGRITTHELRAVQRREPAGRHADRFDDDRHGWHGAPAIDRRAYRGFARFDRNRDGVISAREWRIAQLFWRMPPSRPGWRHDD